MKNLLFLFPALLIGCEEAKTCTEIGCMNGITFNIMDSFGEPAITTHGSITIDETEYTFDCREESESTVICGEGTVFLAIEAGANFSYSIYGGDTESGFGEGTLNFTESTPNGEDCPPVCLNASISVELGRASPPPE